MKPVDPAQHRAHEERLADRLVSAAIGRWLKTAFATARSGNGYSGDEAQGFEKALDQMQYLHLSGAHYSIVPTVLDELRRAGLLVEQGDA